MRAVVQRVSKAQVDVEGDVIGSIGSGYLILLGVGQDDTRAEAEKLWAKVRKLRIMEDDQGKANLSLMDVKGDACIVSQFTLYADCKKGNRPSFTQAGSPDKAEELYEYFVHLAEQDLDHVATGAFGKMMDVSLVNDGPFTIMLDTDTL